MANEQYKLTFTDLFNYPKGTEFYVNGEDKMIVSLFTDNKYLYYRENTGMGFYTDWKDVFISNKWVNEYFYVVKEC